MSADGLQWTELASQDVAMPANIYAGLMISSGSSKVPAIAEFRVIEIVDSLSPDISDNGRVDISDLSLLMQNWLNTNCHLYDWCQNTDINMDDSVNMMDFAVISSVW